MSGDEEPRPASRSDRAKSHSSGRRSNGGVEQTRAKYKEALQTLLPYRKESPKTSKLLPSSHAGMVSFITFTWMTPIMWKAFKKGLAATDLWDLHEADKAERNAKRLTRIWEDEKTLMGKDKASFFKAVWKFGKTRFYVCSLLMVISVILQFLGPSWILKAVLDFQEDRSQPLELGVVLALMAFLVILFRNFVYGAIWSIGIHTGMRVEGAMQYMTYDKLLRLRNGGENILSKAITFCTNDQERIFECVSGGVLAVAAPIMLLFCVVYSCIVLGPWALLGNFVMFMFYPVMGAVARKTAEIRRKSVKYTNKRVGLMTEILSSIRLIKIYAWEESFLDKVHEIRTREESLLRTAAFLQSVSATITPMINIVASVAVYLAYSLCGNNLTPAEAFTIFSAFAAMSFTFGTLPFALRAIGEASVCFRNFQKFLDLPEFETVSRTEDDVKCDHDAVIAIQDGNFAWEVEREDPGREASPIRSHEKKLKSKKNTKDVTKPSVNGVSASGPGDKNPEEVPLTEVNEEPILLEHFLKNIDIQIKRGSLVGVSGTVGSGKSALLSAILGDMVMTSGKILIRGSLAVVSQQAWIYSDSVQENILFGSPMNNEKYSKVLDICCLRPDLASFSHGDLTLIGERGVNLSGGQRQRINLARAIYADKSIYLLDDPLSSVDSVVAKEIFEKCIKTHLKEKTVILVSNGIQFLEQSDEILFMKDGEIVERGSHSILVENGSFYYNMLQYHNQNESKSEDFIPLISDETALRLLRESPSKKKPKSATTVPELQLFTQKIIEDDSKYKFAGAKSYSRYLKAAGGYLIFTLLLTFFLFFGSAQLSTQVWLREWLDAGDGLEEERKLNATEMNTTLTDLTDLELRGSINDNPDLWFYQFILFLLLIVTFMIGLVKGFLSSRFVLRGASKLHDQMLKRIIKSPMGFFDITPMGKITNRFSKDVDELDARLPFFFEFVIQSVIYVLLSLLIVAFVYPTFAIVLVLIIGLMAFLDIFLNVGVRETRKLESVLKTPVIHHIQSSLNGLSIIRTFHRQEPFKIRFASYLNQHLAAESVFRSANRWFTFRMDGVGMLTIFCVMLTAVFYRGSVSPALVGLALSSIYAVCTFVPFVMRMKSELQARFLSVERVLEYAEELDEEEPESKIVIKPKEDWPMNPEIKFESVSIRYQPELPLVLQDLSFVINAGMKVGIIGRTGSGKTSLISALLKLYPLTEGKIVIGDMDINEIALKDLRRSIAVISQDPVLFHGTLRYNLDPFSQYSDNDVWMALDKAHIKEKIEREEKGLLQPVSTDGENFSVGEKQLICLARALLRKNKILLLDEATASLDIETDFLIQNTIREAFESCTVITIAHRLNTVAFYDKILVMDNGQIIEFDTPQNLMDNEESRFSKMMRASGISSLDQLKSNTNIPQVREVDESKDS